MDAYPQLESAWETGAAFLAHHREEAGVHTFVHFVGDAAELAAFAVGTVVWIGLRFEDRGAAFRLHARVVERLTEQPPFGLRLAFLDEETDRRELVLACAEGESIPYLRRKAVRTPCDLAVDVTRADGSTFAARLSNISERGAQIEGGRFHADERIELAIALPHTRLRVRARVTSVLTGLDAGAGLEFQFESARQRETVAADITKFRQR